MGGGGGGGVAGEGTKGWKVRAEQLAQERRARAQVIDSFFFFLFLYRYLSNLPPHQQQKQKKFFSVPIEECVDRPTHPNTPRFIPWVVNDIIIYLKKNSMSLEGLFRLAGEKQSIDEWKKKVDAGLFVVLIVVIVVVVVVVVLNRERESMLVFLTSSLLLPLSPSPTGEILDFEQLNNPHCAADLLKIWFRTLPEPIVTARLYPRFMSVGGMKSEDLQVFFMFLFLC